MNQQVLKKWITDLCSKKFTQGTDCLHSQRGQIQYWDWRGVLCQIYLDEKMMKWGKSRGKPTNFTCLGYENIIPDEVIKWAGWSVVDKNNMYMLTGDVIRHHLKFEQIANFLEMYIGS